MEAADRSRSADHEGSLAGKRRRRKHLRRRLRIGFFWVFALFFSGEAALRVMYYEPLKIRTYPLIYQPDEQFGYLYIPGTEGEICIPSICKHFSINENGYHGPGFRRQKRPGIFRIALVGASNMTGIWLATEENFAMKIQRMFEEADMPIEVNNFSIDGSYRGVENLRLIRKTVLEYQPDLVLLSTSIPLLYANLRKDVYRGYGLEYPGEDPESLLFCQRRVDRILEHQLPIRIYRASFVVRAGVYLFLQDWQTKYTHDIEAFVDKKYQYPNLSFSVYSMADSIREFRELRATLQENDSDLVILMYEHNEEVVDHLDQSGLPYLGLHIPSDPSLVHRHDGHYNENGHRLIAKRLFEGLVRQSHVPDS